MVLTWVWQNVRFIATMRQYLLIKSWISESLNRDNLIIAVGQILYLRGGAPTLNLNKYIEIFIKQLLKFKKEIGAKLFQIQLY